VNVDAFNTSHNVMKHASLHSGIHLAYISIELACSIHPTFFFFFFFFLFIEKLYLKKNLRGLKSKKQRSISPISLITKDISTDSNLLICGLCTIA